MLIYFNGDSNTAGTELENPATQGFAGKLAQKLGADTIINHSKAGCSNHTIFRTTEKYLYECAQQNKYPDLIVIGWTEWGRVDWYHEGSYYSLNPLSVNISSKVTTDANRYTYWKIYQGHNFQYNYQMAKMFNTKIHNLHLELTDLKIPHLFFNAIVRIGQGEEKVMESTDYGPIWRLDWNNRYYQPYNGGATMTTWATEHGHQELTPGKKHFGESLQEEWADILYEHIQQNSIVEIQ